MSKLPRPPIVVILGHVDHGKTTLLDYIRKSHITDKEIGAITQKIGGYEIDTKIKGYPTSRITFIDTPGHEAFSKLRQRGANIADISILVIDATESIKPQTAESIEYIKQAKIPFIVALNKIDLPTVNIARVEKDLLKYNIVVENKGGNIVTVPISAKTGKGVQDLLETLLLVAHEHNLNYSPTPLEAYIVETKKGKSGIMVSVIVKNGNIKEGQNVYYEGKKVKIRAIINDKGQRVKTAKPSQPVEILGFKDIPVVGSPISDQPNLKTKKLETQSKLGNKQTISLEDVIGGENKGKRIKIILKTNNQGSLEAILNKLIENDNLEIIDSGIGDVNKNDIFMAKNSKSIIIGFSINVPNEIRILSQQEKILIKTYDLIYELIEEVSEVVDLLKEKEMNEIRLKGQAKVLATFNIENQMIYGAKATKGKINLSDNIEIYRKDNLIGQSKIVSLKQRAKKVNEVKKDEEFGFTIYPALDIKVGDVIKSIS